MALATAHSNSDSALLYAYKAHALGKQINYTKGMIWGLFKAGDEYIVLTDFNKADSIYHIVLKTSTRLEFKEGIGLGHFGIGKVLFYTGQRTESVKKLETAVDHLKEAKKWIHIWIGSANACRKLCHNRRVSKGPDNP